MIFLLEVAIVGILIAIVTLGVVAGFIVEQAKRAHSLVVTIKICIARSKDQKSVLSMCYQLSIIEVFACSTNAIRAFTSYHSNL